jgi:hypothetical protein
MKYLIASLVVCLAVGTGVLAQQNSPTQQNPPTPPPAEVALTGCVIQGSSPSVLIFHNARKDAKDPADKGVKYLLMIADPDMNIRGHVNHQVEITGTTDGKPAPPADQKVEEKDLPILTVKTLTMIAPTCATPVR